jgi:hypothetical protein
MYKTTTSLIYIGVSLWTTVVREAPCQMSISAGTFRVGCDSRTYVLGRQKMKHAGLSIIQILEKIKYVEYKLRRKWTYSECYKSATISTQGQN